MDNIPLKGFIPLLKNTKSIGIFPHVLADGDGLGSSLALGLALSSIGREVTVYLEEPVPRIYEFLPGKHLIRDHRYGCRHDMSVAVDSGDMERLGDRGPLFSRGGITVNIDHHNTNTGFAQYNFVDVNASAVGEMIWEIINMLELPLDVDISLCLYTAIATDTGGFRYGNTTPETHEIVAELIRTGIDAEDISRKIFDTVSIGKLKLMGLTISSLEFFADGTIAFMTITEAMMRETGAEEEDTDGLVNIGRNIRGVLTAALFREVADEGIKVNLRTNTDMDVAAVAKLHSGGGHRKAAGCTVKGGTEQVKRLILKDIMEAGAPKKHE